MAADALIEPYGIEICLCLNDFRGCLALIEPYGIEIRSECQRLWQ